MMDMQAIQALVRTATDEKVGQMASLEMPDMEFEENAGILYDFNHIAANMLKDEPAIEVPGAPQPIPVDEQVIMAILRLFSEGIYFAMGKCVEMGLTGEPKKIILQNMALEVYNQCRQIIACTYGQEHTPNFQFSHEQQVTMITQSAEGHLMFFIGEYEKEHGPLQLVDKAPPVAPPVAVAPQEASSPPAPDSAPPLLAPESPPVPTPTPVPAPRPTGDHREKYAAVALLLTALSARQRGRVLNTFSSGEKAQILHYADMRHIREELDFGRVQSHLLHFKNWLTQNRVSAPRSEAARNMAKLAGYCSREKLLSWVNDERVGVRRYVESYYETPQAPVPPWRKPFGHQFAPEKTVQLPPRIEDLLYRYLARRLEAEPLTQMGSLSGDY